MPVKAFLLQLARRVVETVINQVTQQVNIVGDQVNDPIEGYLNQIMSGVWVGDDADAFVNEVRSRVLPEIAEILQVVGNINLNINSAAEIVEQADQQVEALVDDLSNTLSQVF